jgi:pilus assembly protein CpaF
MNRKQGSLSGLFDDKSTPASSGKSGADAALAVENEVIDQVTKEFAASVLQDPSAEDRQRVSERIASLTSVAVRKQGLSLPYSEEAEIAHELAQRILGLGFLDNLLPPARTDLSEITIYSHGLVQVMPKSSVHFQTVDIHPSPQDVERSLRKILGPQNKTLNESNPSVNAKLPATEHNPGGGRIKALHQVIVPPGIYPSVNIRLFEQKPVHPEWILERGVMSAEMMADLKRAMEEGYRVLITGGTRTGKTTLLSALCNFLPQGWRIIKMEDPSEIWIDRDTVQTIEARPAALGTDLVPYTLADAVDDAMRMSPDYLITGEVRDGRAGMALFRAMMTGHSGACTFHADSPREAVQRLVTILGADANVPAPEARQMIADSVDLLVQISIPRQIDKRVAMSIQNVCRELRDGEVVFNPIWKIKPDYRSWERVGQLGDRDPDAIKEKNA